ncbi:hypothetical protein ASG25_10365 [Rhizobium sp. Leaf384]|uniref:DUF2306 domain-containing protein n=1 Tax=unclassified Rhizobium TaxID=2613769 RepID=UPI000714CD24|nr:MULTISPECIES: DUF2306 domain-containing protein [unclassified Rhizobium]KQS79554.1 hypothetical protein ASG25_10365 [Rhizobium sp. Leaf384]KQS82972.1 hypothetical protein ASG58_04565 [Rhizobium sp. Leaf383]
MTAVPIDRSRGVRLGWAASATISTALAVVSYRYLAGQGPVPANVAANRHFDPSIAVHAGGAATALLPGPWQFLPGLRARWPSVHRWIGRLYAAGCASGGLAALVLATGLTTGPVAGAGFATLGLAWLATTGLAIREALARRIASHRRRMIRSFALTLSALTLRLYLPLSGVLSIDFQTAYPAIAWVCWLPNLMLAEVYLRRRATGVDAARPVTISQE